MLNLLNLLNLGPNFSPTPKSIPYLEIITAIESQGLNLESGKKDTSAENLRQTVSKILSKTISKKQQDNLSKTQKTALKQLKNDEQIKVYPFDKGIGFALLNDMGDISKIEGQLGKSKIIDYDHTNHLTGKFQRLLRKLKKEGKFDKNTYLLIYPSNCRSPRLYGTLKAHKLEKNYPMRAVVSTMGSPPYGTSKNLVKIIQLTLNKNKNRVLNSYSFVEEAKEWNLSPNEIQTSFDVVNLYPSVPIDEDVAVIIEILNNDIDDLRKRTKLTLTDIQKFIELCLSSNYFLFDNRVRVLKNSGLIGLALVVVISEAFYNVWKIKQYNKRWQQI